MEYKEVWIAWIVGGIGLASTFISIIFDAVLPLLPPITQLLIILIGSAGYGIATIFVYRTIKRKTQNTPDLDKYSKHLRDLMDSLKDHLKVVHEEPTLSNILDKEELKEKYTDYFTAIKKSKRKIAILQHLLTDVAEPNPNISLYSWFAVTQKALKDNQKKPHAGNLRFINDGMIAHFNREFEHIFLSIYDGEPIFGTCDACIEFYAGRNYQKCRNVLDNTKAEKYKWYYSIFD